MRGKKMRSANELTFKKRLVVFGPPTSIATASSCASLLARFKGGTCCRWSARGPWFPPDAKRGSSLALNRPIPAKVWQSRGGEGGVFLTACGEKICTRYKKLDEVRGAGAGRDTRGAKRVPFLL